MSNVLFITSSLFGENSKSRALALDIIQAWRETHTGTRVTVRDTAAIPHLSGDTLAALMTPAAQRSPEQNEAAAFADALIGEIEAADTIVIAAPMYNFAIPSTLKAWIDHIARAGRTFRYTANGPEGLLKGKKIFVASARGGIYSQAPSNAMDFQEPYLRAMLGFLGLSDVTFIHAEGLNISPEAAAHGLRKARAEICDLLPGRAAA
ncbi:MAG TPA: NAD(P)H-dependent oxidoreductase [Micropepsaceae bacterium]|jgi:FMN-dependent NADH-azoreductase|nr:NAD(P)H-dependent oxidoreductase [Micropepsaceae bacterium]